ncbi:MAG: hypothetical protein CVU56_10965 [Deltaproteobacteria bacterium HGW-Deltaproteobacteria-14]|jgi:hypothetical protein|nr:MAG: hypothetical protein CVU56_10965 [Deltaproteobacteria bacterium HGW-Deltaproteobacteria-14]
MNAPTLRFSIAGPERVRLGEAVPIDLALTNTGATPILVNGRFVVDEDDALDGTFEVSFAVTDPHGAPVGFLADVDGFDPSEADLVLLAPGAAHAGRVRLDRYFMLSEPGEHRLTATYRNTLALERDGRSALVGTCVADPITLEVSG